MRRLAVILLAASLLIFTLLWLWAAVVHPKVYVEHGPMENFQAGCLALGAVLFGYRSWRTARAERAFFGALALFYVTFLLLEFDTREFDWPAVNAVLNGLVRNIWLGALWLVAGLCVNRYRRAVIAFARSWLRSTPGLLLMAAGVFWIFGGVVDKTDPFPLRARNLLAEELFEVNAALLMILSALNAVRGARPDPISTSRTDAPPAKSEIPSQPGVRP